MNIHKLYIKLHNAIHDRSKDNIIIEETIVLPINISKLNGCRNIRWKNILFIEQNRDKNSEYAKRARNGERLTWAIDRGVFTLITDKGINI